MKRLNPITFLLALSIMAAILAPPSGEPQADPILKPKKYHGPIPRRSFGISIGFLAGPNNEQMYKFLDGSVDQPLQSRLKTTDFEAAPQIDVYYTAKMHPNFALRGVLGAGFLSSDSKGFAIASEPDTSGLAPLLAFERKFDVLLLSFDATGLYYFQDASVSEFQVYVGGGFTVFFPIASFEQETTLAIDDGNGNILDTGQPYSAVDKTESGIEPGVHGVLGFLYHIKNNFAIFAEGKYQIGQSKFSLSLPTRTAGVQDLNFDVSYSGLIMAIGISRFF